MGALEAYAQEHLVICCDEKSGMQVLERKAPTKPAQKGRRERREHEYIRHGTRVLINLLAVATGQIAWTIGAARQALTSKEVTSNQGIFTHTHMETLWKDIAPFMRGHFLRLMERFDLSYRTLHDKKEISLIVELLPLDPPDNYEMTWNEIKTRSA